MKGRDRVRAAFNHGRESGVWLSGFVHGYTSDSVRRSISRLMDTLSRMETVAQGRARARAAQKAEEDG